MKKVGIEYVDFLVYIMFGINVCYDKLYYENLSLSLNINLKKLVIVVFSNE